MKKIKWLATLLVVASIVLGVIGCSSPSSPSSPSGPSGPSGSGNGGTQGAIVPEMVEVKGATITGAAYTNNYDGVFVEGRTVTLSDFYMGKYEVTQEEYASVMAGQKVTVAGVEYALESNPSCCTKDSTSYTLFSGDEQKKTPSRRCNLV